MAVFRRFVQAALTVVAMEEAVLSSDSAKTTLVAVVDALLVTEIIVEITDVTEIQGEVLLAALAGPALGLL